MHTNYPNDYKNTVSWMHKDFSKKLHPLLDKIYILIHDLARENYIKEKNELLNFYRKIKLDYYE